MVMRSTSMSGMIILRVLLLLLRRRRRRLLLLLLLLLPDAEAAASYGRFPMHQDMPFAYSDNEHPLAGKGAA